jgi:hypothetical protein
MRRLRRLHQRQVEEKSKLRKRAIAAGTAAAITFGVGTNLSKSLAAYIPDTHELVVNQDADADLLANHEETAIGYLPFTTDQNNNQTPDGVELARHCASMVNGLPIYIPGSMMPIPNNIYKVKYDFFGTERCDICGQEVNMGGWEIINPMLGLHYPDPNDSLDVAVLPELAVHYMEHGSFDCFGDTHQGRVDTARLLRVLEQRFPYDPNEHRLIPERNDLDGDLLTDSEELAAGFNLYNADQNDNLIPDGPELAGQCMKVINEIPVQDPNGPEIQALHKIQFFQRGLETCDICGETVNMGYWKIVNLKLGLSTDIPVISCHYMEHGSFSYSGNVHNKNRIDVALLVKILEMPRKCGDLGTVYSPADVNHDCRVDSTDLKVFIDQWLECSDANQDIE